MRRVLVVLAVALTAGNLALLGVCWKRRTALGGVLGACGAALALYALINGRAHDLGAGELGGAAIAIVLGLALYGLGQTLGRLLDRDPDELP